MTKKNIDTKNIATECLQASLLEPYYIKMGAIDGFLVLGPDGISKEMPLTDAMKVRHRKNQVFKTGFKQGFFYRKKVENESNKSD